MSIARQKILQTWKMEGWNFSLNKWRRAGKNYRDIWERYLDHLAVAVDDLRMAFDCDVVLGCVESCLERLINELKNSSSTTFLIMIGL